MQIACRWLQKESFGVTIAKIGSPVLVASLPGVAIRRAKGEPNQTIAGM
jgi:hypothetical protein